MKNFNGFTLIETSIASLVLITGLAAVAGACAYSSLRSSHVLSETTAIALLSSKMEDLRRAPVSAGQYTEYVFIDANGVVLPSEPVLANYICTWEVTAGTPRRVTVIVRGRIPGVSGPFRELARATTMQGDRF